ncbi:MAG: class I SAM-dependent methyltransferase [Alphaproteobacteria bacterium]|nr:class I SAM-dependent methyltransferase [Alphaproteobacteria bacterium]MCL2889949.1 class I SAM-dependent methyltransferase [Alphaproteobacteria bacterium]
MTYLLIGLLVLWLLFAVFMILLCLEVGATFIIRSAPEVPSSRRLRDAVAAEIRKNYPDAKTAIDVGSGWGGMARRVAREFPKMKVTGAELMPLAFICSWIARAVFGPRNCRFVLGDAVKFIKKSKGFDIGICYSGTGLMRAVAPVKNKFKIIIALDFPLPDAKPTRTIQLHKDTLGQHVLYVYEK